MALKKRAKIVLWILGVFVLLGIVLAFAGWRFYKVYRNPERFMNMARSLTQQEEYDAAMDQYRRALQFSRTNEKRAEVLREMADTLYQQSPLPIDEAFSAYRSMLGLYAGICRNDRDDKKVRRELLTSQFWIAQTSDAEWAWRALKEVSDLILRIDGDSQMAEKYQAIARLKLDRGKTEEGLFYDEINTTLQELWDLNPDDTTLPYYLSLSNLVEASQNDGDYMPIQGRALIQAGVERMDRVVKRSPNSVEARIARLKIMAQSAWLLKEFDRVPEMRQEIMDVEALVEEEELDSELAIQLAHLVLLSQRLQAASEAEEGGEAVKIPPEEEATALSRAGTILRHAAEKDPDNVRLMVRVALNLREAARLEEAREWLNKAMAEREVPISEESVAASNAQLHARFLAADLLLQLYEASVDPDQKEQYITGVREHLRALDERVDGESPYLKLLEGRLAYHNGQYRAAVKMLTEAQESLGRRTPEATLFSGLGLARLGETGAAVRQLAEFLSTPGTNREQRERAWLQMASSAIQLRDFQQAVKIGRRLLAENPEDQEVNLLLGRALVLQLLTGRVTNREEIFQEVITLLEPLAQKGNSEALRQLAEVYELAGDWPKAKQLLLDYCKEHTEDTAAIVQLYYGLRRADQEDQAKDWIRKILSDLPESEAGELVRRAVAGDKKFSGDLNRLLTIALTKDQVDQYINLAALYRSKGLSQDADRLLVEAGNIAPEDARVLEANFMRAIDRGHVSRAEQLFDEFAETEPADAEVALWQAHLLIAREDYARATNVLESAVSSDPNRSDLYRVLGEAHRLNGDLFKADEYFRKALELKPNQPFALRRLIHVSAKRGLHHQAINYMRRALTYAPADKELVNVFLDYLSEYGSTDEALEIRLRVAASRPDDFANRRAIAELYQRSRQLDRAKGVLQKLIEDAPDNFANVISMARFEARSGEPEKGTQRLQTFLAEHEDAPFTEWLQFAEYLRRTGQGEAAENAAQQAIKRDDSETMQATQYRAQLQLENGRYKEALKTYQNLLAEKPAASARLGLARTLVLLEKPREALEQVQQLESNGETLAGLYQIKAEAQLALKNYDAAYRAATKAVEQSPQVAENYFLRAKAKFNDPDEQRQKQVLSDLEKTLELSSRMPQARMLLTEWFARNGRLAEAVTEAQRLVSRYPQVPQFRRNLGNLFLQGGMYDRLEQHLKDWEEATPDSDMIVQFRARLAESRGDFPEAIRQWQEVFKRSPSKNTLQRYLSVLVKAGQAAAAVDLIESGGQEDIPEEPVFLALYARALAMNDQADKAKEVFQRALAATEGKTALLKRVIQHARQALSPEELLPLLAQSGQADDGGFVSLVMGQLRLGVGELEAGARELESLLKKLPDNSPLRGQLLTALGTAYSQLGQDKRAEQTYREALKVLPNDPVILNNLAYAMAASDSDPFEAVKLARQAIDAGSHSDSSLAYYLDTLGYAQLKADLNFRARQSLERSIGLEKMAANTYHLGLVLLAENEPAEAKEMLTEALQLAKKGGTDEDQDDIEEALEKATKAAASLPAAKDGEGDEAVETPAEQPGE